MGWARIDDDFPNHPKVWRVGAEGVALFLEGLCHASKFLTDGVLARPEVERMRLVKRPLTVAQKLVEVGLWEQDGENFRIHDYHDYNPPSNAVRERRAANRERVSKWRDKQNESETNAPSNALRNDHVTDPTLASARSAPAPALGRDGGRSSGFPRRRHPLDESTDYSQDPEHSERAERFLGEFSAWHADVLGARFVGNYERDRPHALRLVTAYSGRELEALTCLYLRAKGDHFDGKPRTIGRLAEAASMIEEQMKREGKWPTA